MCLAPGDLCLRMMEPMHYITALIVGLTVWLFTRHFRKNNHDLKEILWSGSFWKWSGSLDIIMHSVVFVVILTVSTSILVCLQSNNSKPNYGDLKKTITASFMCRSHPGMVVAVVKDRKTVFSEAFGVLLPGSKVKVTRETKFMIAYLTKAFTAALLVNVFANNPRNKSYDLKTPLRDILGSNFSFADDERTRYASAEDLLSHLIAWPKKGLMRFNPSLKRSDFIRFARYWKTELTFRGKAKYCSVAYTLAAAITEYLGEKPWENLITERIFNPLGMTSTGFAFSSNFSQDDVAKPYYTVRQKISIDPLFTKLWNSRCGSGCIMTTIDDMAKWINFILSHGKNASGHQVMPLGEVKSLTKTRTYLRSSRRDFIRKPLFPVTSVTDEYALGWRNGFYKGYKTVSHTGSSPGYSSILMMYPHENMGIFVSMTGDDYAFSYRLALVHYISDVMLGHPPWLNTSTLCTFPEPWKRQKQHPSPVYDVDLKPALPYIEYIGVYKSPLYGEVFVNFNSSTFFLQGFYGFGSWQLLPQKQENNFYGRGIWTTDFWDVSGFQFVTKDNDSSTITKVLIDDLDPRDYPLVFEKEFK